MSKSTEMPKTQTPAMVYVVLVALALGPIGVLLIPFSFWLAFAIGLATFAATLSVCTENVSEFHALIVMNAFGGRQRTLFQGLNFKLPWETAQNGQIDLRTELEDVCDDTYPTLDGQMVIKYVYTIKPNVSGSDPGANIIRWASFENKAIQELGMALFSRSLSDYYGKHCGSNLLNKEKTNNDVFGNNPIIADFEKAHGAQVTVTLKDGDFDPETQKARDTRIRAEAFNNAVLKLVDEGKIERAEAVQIVKMMSFDDITERILNVKISAPDLQNLRDVTVLGNAGMGDDKKGGKK